MKKIFFLYILAIQVSFAQAPFKSEEVNYWNTADSAHIFGTLTMPENGSKFPAVLLITGSGTQDRDETILGHKPFKVIAEYLTGRGFTVLRVDDRGAGKTTLGKNPKAITSENFAKDVKSGIDYLKTRSEINSKKIGLIGHSEGGMIAPMVASQTKDVAYIVSLAGTGVNGKIVAGSQIEIMRIKAGFDTLTAREFVGFNDKVLDIIINEDDPKVIEAKVKTLLGTYTDDFKIKNKIIGQDQAVIKSALNSNIPWVKFFMGHDPAEDWQKVKCPVLALNGTKDTQVDANLHLPAIENALKKGKNKHYKIVKLEGLNHLFQHAETGLVNEYAKIKEDFAPEALQIMGDWLLETTKK
ncbi:alpha/beta hydrolase family protein [Emticicia sp. SJ17W-69]|uniref:alpha/beta hydrolase family protein n=1 Tax=Emticicia sp. SJ17W-69 TaxID=3421657 RepID=UPI003EB84B82